MEELADHGAKNFLFIGTDAKCGWKRKRWVRQDDIFMSEDLPALIAHELKKKRHKKCYVSIDLDVLDHKEIPTGYGRGKITLRHLLTILTTIQEHKEILGADILGLCRKDGGSYYARGNKPQHYYHPTGYLTYGIIAAHLAGKDYQDALEVRDRFIELDENGKNGKKWTELAKGVAF